MSGKVGHVGKDDHVGKGCGWNSSIGNVRGVGYFGTFWKVLVFWKVGHVGTLYGLYGGSRNESLKLKLGFIPLE